jgi:hypothetical protein
MWNRLVARLLPPETQFDSVTMLGGRNAVEKACRLDQKEDGRRRIYIVDGDLDFLLGKTKKSLKYFYRIRACTIENVLSDERIVEQVAMDYGAFPSLAHARLALDYSHSVLAFERALRDLCVVYALEQQLDVGGKSPRVSAESLLHRVQGRDELSAVKIYRAIRKVIRNAVRQFGVNTVVRERRRISDRSSSLDLGRAVVGKDYIFPAMRRRLASACGCRISADQLKVQLAKEMVAVAEPFLARRLAAL